jgi:hypothetical protein
MWDWNEDLADNVTAKQTRKVGMRLTVKEKMISNQSEVGC